MNTDMKDIIKTDDMLIKAMDELIRLAELKNKKNSNTVKKGEIK